MTTQSEVVRAAAPHLFAFVVPRPASPALLVHVASEVRRKHIVGVVVDVNEAGLVAVDQANVGWTVPASVCRLGPCSSRTAPGALHFGRA